MTPLPALLAFAAALAPVPAATRPPPAAATTTTPAAVAEGNRRFALGLYRELARNEEGNIFFSPASIAFAFGPLVAGAGGETRAGIGRALSLPETGDGLHPALAALQHALERDGGEATISIANALWLNRGFTPRPVFLETARSRYDATVETLDISGDASGAAARINHWAETETRGRIPRVVGPGDLDPDSALVVTNAVYFLADWAQPFPPGTQRGRFTLADGGQREAWLMRQRNAYRHYRGSGFAALDLPYRDEDLVMTVLLPDRADGLPALERRLSPAMLDQVLHALDAARPADVDLALPRLDLRAHYALDGPLVRLGMGAAFGDHADFRELSDTPVRISRASQFTFLKVDERGTEAAAVTVVQGVVITGIRYLRPPIVFHADHPFLFMLRDRESGAILFFGRIVRPE